MCFRMRIGVKCTCTHAWRIFECMLRCQMKNIVQKHIEEIDMFHMIGSTHIWHGNQIFSELFQYVRPNGHNISESLLSNEYTNTYFPSAGRSIDANAGGAGSVCRSTPARLCKTRYNTTAPMYGVSLTSGQPVTIVQKFPDLLQQVVFEVCE